MASSKEFVQSIVALGGENCRVRPMMGEYVLYYREKVVGDICDDRLLVKVTPASVQSMSEPVYELPYPGAKPMLRVHRLEPTFLQELFENMYDELPAPKKRK